MACCDKIRLDRLRDFTHMSIIAYRFSQVNKEVIALFKSGEEYDFKNYEDAKREGIRILRKFKPGDSF